MMQPFSIIQVIIEKNKNNNNLSGININNYILSFQHQ